MLIQQPPFANMFACNSTGWARIAADTTVAAIFEKADGVQSASGIGGSGIRILVRGDGTNSSKFWEIVELEAAQKQEEEDEGQEEEVSETSKAERRDSSKPSKQSQLRKSRKSRKSKKSKR